MLKIMYDSRSALTLLVGQQEGQSSP